MLVTGRHRWPFLNSRDGVYVSGTTSSGHPEPCFCRTYRSRCVGSHICGSRAEYLVSKLARQEL
jgi:hypothetical protein